MNEKPNFSDWEVKSNQLVNKKYGHTVRMGCHHRQTDCCGGCYARAYLALLAIKNNGNAKDIVKEYFKVTTLEAKKSKIG
jgi:hypothetical protein